MRINRKQTSAGSISRLTALAILAAVAPTVAQAQVKPNVTVVNPVSNPVNTRITNAVVPVEVSNADPIPVSVPDPEATRQIFEKVVNVSLGGGIGNCSPGDPITVPAGKRLVIEYVSGSGALGAPAEIVRIALRHPSAPDDFLVVPAGKTASTDGVNYSAAGQHVRAYSDGNLWACATASAQSGGAVQVIVLGYLLDTP